LARREFLRRFLLHVLPKGFMRIRHYGYLTNRVRVKQPEKIRECPGVGTASTDILNAQPPEHCPKCKTGFLRLIGEIASERERRWYGELT